MWSPQRADKICWVSVEFSWDKKQTQHLRASQICLACLPGFLSKQVPGQASSWDEPRFMGYPETLLCFKKEKKKRNQGPFPPFIFPNKHPEIFNWAYCIIHESDNTSSHYLFACNYKSRDWMFTFSKWYIPIRLFKQPPFLLNECAPATPDLSLFNNLNFSWKIKLSHTFLNMIASMP